MKGSPDLTPLCERLRLVVGQASFRQIGDATGTHPETVRRYMHGQSPSVEFVGAVCEHYQVNGEWLLTGQGPMRRAEVKSHVLRQAGPSDLLGAVASGLERTGDRLDRVERFLHTLEARLRGAAASSAQRAAHTPTTNGSADHSAPAPAHPAADLEAKPRARGQTRIPIEGTISGPDATVKRRSPVPPGDRGQPLPPGSTADRARAVADALPGSPRRPGSQAPAGSREAEDRP